MNHSFSSSWQNMVHTFTAGLKDWGSLHPIIVHIPIALLLIAPVFIVFGLIFKKAAKSLYLSALILMLIGTLGIFFAISTGNEASKLIQPNPNVVATLSTHVRLAETIRLNFSVLTILFATYMLLISRLPHAFNTKIFRAIPAFFLAIYACNFILLFNTAHQGGILVHKHNIHSSLYTQ